MKYLPFNFASAWLKRVYQKTSVVALIFGFTSLFVYEILAQVVGFQIWSPVAFMLLVQLSLLIGFLPRRFSCLDRKISLFFVFILIIAFGLFWGPIVEIAADSIVIKFVFILGMMGILSSVFRMVNLELYRKGPNLGSWYGVFHVQALIGFLAALTLDEIFSKYVVFLIFSLFLLVQLMKYRNGQRPEMDQRTESLLESRHRQGWLDFIWLSIISGFQGVWLWQVIQHSLRTTGWEFIFWQGALFLALGSAPALAKRVRDMNGIGILWLTTLTVLPGLLWVLPKWSGFLNGGSALVGAAMLIFSVPLFITALLIPAAERQGRGPWLWFSVLSNTLGVILALLTVQWFDIRLMGMLIVSALSAFVVLRAQTVRFLVVAVTSAIMSFVCLWNLNHVSLLRGARVLAGIQTSAGDEKTVVYPSPGQTAVLSQHTKSDPELWLNSYSTVIGGLREVHQALYGQPNLLRGGRRILVLGLGNTQLVSAIQRMLLNTEISEYELDVIENFSPLVKPELQKSLAVSTGFNAHDQNLRIKSVDAFEFLRGQHKKYDLVYWNLSQPFGAASARLYTPESLRRVQGLIGSSGSFIAFLDPTMITQPSLVCLYKSIFPSGRFFPGLAESAQAYRHYFVVDRSVQSWPDLDGNLNNFACESISVPRLEKNPFNRSMVYFGRFKNLEDLYGPRSLQNLKIPFPQRLPLALRWSLLQVDWGKPWLAAGSSSQRMSALRASEVIIRISNAGDRYSVNPSLGSGSPLETYEKKLLQLRPQIEVAIPPNTLDGPVKLEESARDLIKSVSLKNPIRKWNLGWSPLAESGFYQWDPLHEPSSDSEYCAFYAEHQRLFHTLPDFSFAYFLSKWTGVPVASSASYFEKASGRLVRAGRWCPDFKPSAEFEFHSLPDKPKSVIFKNNLKFWSEQSSATILANKWSIAPCSSDQIEAFVKSEEGLKNQKWINCVTALEKFDDEMLQISSFPGASQYLRGVLKSLEKKLGSPKNVYILFDKESIYLMDGLSKLKQFSTEDLPNSLIFEQELESRNPLFLSENDWVILWSAMGPSEGRGALHAGYKKAHKIFLYGSIEADRIGMSIPNSTQVLFWHPEVAYEPDGLNCQYVHQYRKRFGTEPDFHGAYFWANLQLASGQAKTLFGTLKVDSRGRPQDFRPILFTRRDQGHGEWDLFGNERYFCRQR